MANIDAKAFILAIFGVALSTLVRIPLAGLMHSRVSFITYFPAIVFAAWFGGWTGGLVALLLCSIIITFVQLPSISPTNLHDPTQSISLIVFLIVGICISAMGDAQRKHRLALSESEAQYGRLLETSNEGILIVDPDAVITYCNPAAAGMFGFSCEEHAWTSVYDIVYAADQEKARERREQRRKGIEEQYEMRFRCKDGSELWTLANSAVLRENVRYSGTLSMLTDITARKRDEAALKSSEERLRLAVDGAIIGTWHWHIQSGKLFWSETMVKLLGLPPTDSPSFDTFLSLLHPDDRERTQKVVADCIANKADYDTEFRVVWPDGSVHWQVARGRCYMDERDEVVRMEGIAIEITERKLAEQELRANAERADLLNTIERAIRATVDPDQIQQAAVQALGAALHADRCYFSIFRCPQHLFLDREDYRRGDLPSLAGHYDSSGYDDVRAEDYYPNGATLVINDVETWEIREDIKAALLQLRVRAGLGVPLYDNGRMVATLSIAMADEPRIWTAGETTLAEAVAAQTRAAVESARLLAETQAQAKRLALEKPNRAAIRSSLDPEVIKAKAAHALGEALDADRCYFAAYDLATGIVTIAPDFHRSDLPPVEGVYPFPNTVAMFQELYKDSNTSVIPDAYASTLSEQTIANMKRLQLRARVSVALVDADGPMATLTASMSDAPRDWTTDEVKLVEYVATQLRTAMELARLQHREHRIATELQRALQPATPDHVPGLTIASFTKPALNESEVGGDFYDVFPIDKELYAVVIGDVSGKGLAAAAQLATVRNMLRGFLYQFRSPAEAVTGLNNILTTYDLLIGFVTAFVGVFDAASGKLVYASCGHEPGLIRRAETSAVESLVTTGPPLGAAENVTYGEQTVTLSQYDLLLLYTDGLSEAGPSRLNMLGTEGLIRLLSNTDHTREAGEIAAKIITDVSAYSEGAFRDDVCILLARRQ